jgi:hypothetical protein
MTIRTFLAAAASVAALSAPAYALAQSAGDISAARDYAVLEGFHGYPELRAEKDRIRDQIRQGRDDGSLSLDQARDFRAELARIQDDEALNFRDSGWTLPVNVRQDLRASLDDLSEAVDDARTPG